MFKACGFSFGRCSRNHVLVTDVKWSGSILAFVLCMQISLNLLVIYTDASTFCDIRYLDMVLSVLHATKF